MCRSLAWKDAHVNLLRRVLQLLSKSSPGVRAKLVAREIDILQRELDTKAVVYVMGRAHMHMRSQAKSAFEWYALPHALSLSLPYSEQSQSC